jgi:hypothetical protein
MEEVHRLRITAVLTAYAQLEVRAGLATLRRRNLNKTANSIDIKGFEG